MLLFIGRPHGITPQLYRFQYISCYYLSAYRGLEEVGGSISIHLMLLFIFEPILKKYEKTYFNTSHVTVYLDGSYPLSVVFVISIHLMLLFIS